MRARYTPDRFGMAAILEDIMEERALTKAEIGRIWGKTDDREVRKILRNQASMAQGLSCLHALGIRPVLVTEVIE